MSYSLFKQHMWCVFGTTIQPTCGEDRWTQNMIILASIITTDHDLTDWPFYLFIIWIAQCFFIDIINKQDHTKVNDCFKKIGKIFFFMTMRRHHTREMIHSNSAIDYTTTICEKKYNVPKTIFIHKILHDYIYASDLGWFNSFFLTRFWGGKLRQMH